MVRWCFARKDYICVVTSRAHKREKEAPGRETFCSSHRKYLTSEGKQTSKWCFFQFVFPLWIQMCNGAMTGGFTISFRASRASMSPILAAAHASGGVRASRMAANSCGRHQMFRDRTSRPKSGIWKKAALLLWSKKKKEKVAHLFAADAQRFGDDLDESAVTQTQIGACKVQTHLTADVLSHQLHSVTHRNKLTGRIHSHTHTQIEPGD